MHGCIKPALDHPNGLMTFLLILPSDCRKNQDIKVIENPHAKGKGEAMLFPVGRILSCVEFDLHSLCILHMVAWRGKVVRTASAWVVSNSDWIASGEQAMKVL
jgi:hypothetical protein